MPIPHPQFDRRKITFKPLRERRNRVQIARDFVRPEQPTARDDALFREVVRETAAGIRQARAKGAAVILSFGAHAIKNGLGPLLIRLMEEGWLTHLATNGAGIIHDWEFAYRGESSEDVRANVARGQFGMWEETGTYLNVALAVGAYEGKGYGEAVGSLIANDGVHIPDPADLLREAGEIADSDPDRAAAALDLLALLREVPIPSGWLEVRHDFTAYSAQAAAFRLGIPFTGHPMFGHDIIYAHPANCGGAVGRAALRDFLAFVRSVQQLEHGVYLSVGSAVMSPMIFEKALSMARNIELQAGRNIANHAMFVVDLAESRWDWQQDGEPPESDPAYYLRYCKTFSRMGGTMRYLSADNRDFLLALYHALSGTS